MNLREEIQKIQLKYQDEPLLAETDDLEVLVKQWALEMVGEDDYEEPNRTSQTDINRHDLRVQIRQRIKEATI